MVKTEQMSARAQKRGKQPHVRGEDFLCLPPRKPAMETPPRVWGRHLLAHTPDGSGGNTPTCVGKTIAAARESGISRKHPHVRGEDGFGGFVTDTLIETPPRAWGRLQAVLTLFLRDRTTPTCVGKTTFSQQGLAKVKKHPHVRGEDLIRHPLAYRNPETPPRAWGRPAILRARGHPARNTPTCVGKTERRRSGGEFRQKHPHVRGEDTNIL